MGSLLFLFTGLVFLGIAAWRLLAIKTYSFKTKNMLVQEKMMVLLAGVGIIILLFWVIFNVIF